MPSNLRLPAFQTGPALTDEQAAAVADFQRCAREWLDAAPDEQEGRRYALSMAGEECLLLGLDPNLITPTGYDDEH